jgi:ferric-dicitrate binding protein FerR (iron transport regulator)
MKPDALRHNLSLVVAGLLFLPTLAFSQQALSHVRVVRLSYVSGTVALKRPGSTVWAKALVNTPVQEGFELSTSTGSYAEVVFENGSTARLGELSIVDFSQLALDAEGNKLNHLTFERGHATFHFMPEQQDAYSVKIADATLTPGGKSEFRTDLREGRIRVEVFNGSVAVVAASGSVKLGKHKVLEFKTGTTEEVFNIRQGIHKDSWDKWVDARDAQAQLALRDQAVSPWDPQLRRRPELRKSPGI